MTFNFSPKGYRFTSESESDIKRIHRLKARFGDLVTFTKSGCEVNVDDMTALEEHELSDLVKEWRHADATS
jgi:hypothetical protein